MNSTPNPYTFYHGDFGEQKSLGWTTDDGAYQHTTISGLVSSFHLEPYPDWVSQQLEDLMAIDAKLRELQLLCQDALARLRAQFNATSTATSMWSIPPQPTTSTSSPTASHAQTVPHPPPQYTAYNRAGENAFGYETRVRDVTLAHGKKSHICDSCGKGYTRKDSLRRHKVIHESENPYI